MSAVAAVVTGKDEAAPIVVVDADRQGKQFENSLRTSALYQKANERIVSTSEFAKFDNSELEDLWPEQFLASCVSRIVRGQEDDFEDVFKSGSPIIPQIEAYAARAGVPLELGSKVELARAAKKRLSKEGTIPGEIVDMWVKIFERFEG